MLKNKTLFKLYKYLVVLFKFMNKHFYIIPLLSLLSKLRKPISLNHLIGLLNL
jgi:hypothetical protein